MGVAAKRKRGAKGLRMPVDPAMKDMVDIQNISAHIKSLKSKQYEM